GAARGPRGVLRGVVEPQIQEEPLAESANRLHRGASVSHEQLEAYPEQADVTQPPGSEPLRRARIADVEGGADPVHRERFPPPSRTAAWVRSTTSCNATTSRSFAPLAFHSTLPSASPFFPTAMRRGSPIRSASLNLTPARSSRSSRKTSTPASANSRYSFSAASRPAASCICNGSSETWNGAMLIGMRM